MKLGIIGYGNLGKALVRGLVRSGVSQNNIIVNARSQSTLDNVKKEFENIYISRDKKELVNKADTIILVVEPGHASEVLNELSEYDIQGKIIVSFMAGITIKEIADMIGEAGQCTGIIRVMPNVAIANCNGVLGIAYDDSDYNEIKGHIKIFEKLGYAIKIKEESLETITVTAASGVAFAASLMKSYQNASRELLGNDIMSREVTIRVFENVIDMIKTEDSSFDEIVERIATKGGTTEAGINSLNQDVITETIEDCMREAYQKAKNIIGE